MFGKRIMLVAAAAIATSTLCGTPAGNAADGEFITLDSVVKSQADGLLATGVYLCDGGIGYLDVSAQMDTNGSGNVSLTSYPPGQVLQCTGGRETWSAVLKSNISIPLSYTTGTGKAQLNRKYWQVDSGQVALTAG
ncbi:hypothetical protein [Nocardia huaxiensis]|uniref:Uncharacterized protein n=1 Tax=Nocardia huaxiensis TaxID=2755382 RepID=A0A7D6YZ50_9NOCA|nr:hypothetical protein [Nocardia huaxiensis]QLY28006.1 hypothetical protein H0264_21595 [Nocardia huaxiensis]UFS98588.1 hypothetical protein LPY97_12160 [Nocardia huaxiensis]